MNVSVIPALETCPIQIIQMLGKPISEHDDINTDVRILVVTAGF